MVVVEKKMGLSAQQNAKDSEGFESKIPSVKDRAWSLPWVQTGEQEGEACSQVCMAQGLLQSLSSN